MPLLRHSPIVSLLGQPVGTNTNEREEQLESHDSPTWAPYGDTAPPRSELSGEDLEDLRIEKC